MSYDLPERYRVLLADWHPVAIPSRVDAQRFAIKLDISAGGYLVIGNTIWLESDIDAQSIAALFAAEAVSKN